MNIINLLSNFFCFFKKSLVLLITLLSKNDKLPIISIENFFCLLEIKSSIKNSKTFFKVLINLKLRFKLLEERAKAEMYFNS